MVELGSWVVIITALVLGLAVVGLLGRRWVEARSRLQQQVAELEALSQVGRALVEAELDPAALYELIYDQASTIIDTSTFLLGLLDDGRLEIVVWVREGERQPPTVFDIGQEEGLVGWVALHREPLLIHDYQSEWDSLPARPRYLSDDPPRSAVFVPLIAGRDCIGVLAAQSFAVGAFSRDDVRRLSIVANQAASAISSARLFQEARTRAAQLELLSRVSRQVRALTPLPDLFQRTVDLIQDTFGHYCVGIYSHDADVGGIELQASTWDELAGHLEEAAPGQGLVEWAATHAETVLVNDVSADPRYLELSILPDTRSEIVVPLVIEDQVLGALDVQSDRLNAFGAGDRFALEALADQIALAIQESRLYSSERQQRSVAETLREVAQTITSSLDLETVLNSIIADLRRVLAYDAAAIILLEEARQQGDQDPDDTMVVRAAQGLPTVVGALGKRLKLRDSARLSQLARGTEPIIFGSADPAGCYHALLDLPPEHSCLGAPLVARGELIGFLTADALLPHTFRPEDADVVATFAGQAAVAIDNARLFASQREEAWVSSALLQVVEATSQSAELDEVLNAIVHMTLVLVGVDRCGVLLWEDDRGGFRGAQLAGSGADLSDEFPQLWIPLNLWPPLAALKAQPQPVVLGGGEALSALPDELFDFFGLDAWLLVLPLVAKGELIGVMLVSGETSDVALIRRRVELISGIASQAAMAIQSARLYSAQQEEAYTIVALLQVAEAVNRLTDLSEILTTIVRLAPMLTGVEQCLVLYRDPEQGAYVAGPAYGLDADQLLLLENRLSEPSAVGFLSGLEQALEAQAIEHIGAGAGYPNPLPEGWAGLIRAGTLLAFPLVTRRELVGAMLVSLPADGARLGVRRRNMLTGMAHQAAVAIENNQLYAEAAERERMERELEVAREIQSSFLPETHPEAPGWSVGSLWQAARQVGGDFYDFFPVRGSAGDGRWLVVVADVADKGVPAALYMALSRTLIRTVGHSRDDPASILERVNDILLADSRSDLFVSVVCALWDPQESRVTLANAGHNPPLCVRADGTVEALKSSNMVLGVVPGVSVDNHTIHLEPGEALILYTDGITDAINEEEEEFGQDRLEAVAYAGRYSSASEIVDEIQDAVAGFVGQAPQFDDLTLVVIKREGGKGGTD